MECPLTFSTRRARGLARGRLCLLIACGLFASCGGLEPDPQARAAAEWALDRGGSVLIFGQTAEIDNIARLPRQGYALEAIDMNELDIDAPPVTDKDLEVLKGLANIRTLGLYGSEVTDAGCEIIATLTTLRELELSQSRISDEGLKTLATLPNLERLFIRNVGDAVTDDGAKYFTRRSDAELIR